MDRSRDTSTDAALEQAAAEGDREAFANLYERHFARVYDFVRRMVRDADVAEDLTQETFLRAMRALSPGTKRAAFSTWLFTIARHLTLNRLQQRRRQITSNEEHSLPLFAQVDTSRLANPEEGARAAELADLVWDAACGLDPKQASLLDLHLRQGLDSAAIAEVLGVSKGNAYTMLSRVKDTFESSVVALLLFRHGGSTCAELGELLRAQQVPNLTPQMRKVVQSHVTRCDACRDRSRRLLSPAELFGAFAPVPVPVGLKQRVGEAWTKSWPGTASTPARTPPKGIISGGTSTFRSLPQHLKTAIIGGSLVALLGATLGGWLATNSGGDGGELLVHDIVASSTPAPTLANGVPPSPTVVATESAAHVSPAIPAVAVEVDVGTCAEAGTWAFSDIPLPDGSKLLGFGAVNPLRHEGALWAKSYSISTSPQEVLNFYRANMTGWEPVSEGSDSVTWRKDEGRLTAWVEALVLVGHSTTTISVTREDVRGVPSDEGVKDPWPFDQIPTLEFDAVCIQDSSQSDAGEGTSGLGRIYVVDAGPQEVMQFYSGAMAGWGDSFYRHFGDSDWEEHSTGDWSASWSRSDVGKTDVISMRVIDMPTEPGKTFFNVAHRR